MNDVQTATVDHMTTGTAVRRLLVGTGGARRFGGSRWAMLAERFPDLPDMQVLDLGGSAGWWKAAPIRPARVVTVNLLETEAADSGVDWIDCRSGDACDLGPELMGGFDLVFSNSLLEHLGGPLMRERCAEQIRRAGPHHWVQTPYRYFPIEPHWLFPGMQFLPVKARAALSQRWPLGAYQDESNTWEGAVETVLSVDLVSRTEMTVLFPDSGILVERLAGLPKSLIAIH